MLVYVATTNPGKLHELRELTAGSDLHLMVDETYEAAPEGDTSYADNAAAKARSLRASLLARGIHAAVLADDSGLEVAALNGQPGVLSARYGGEQLSWAERRALLVGELSTATDRSARFVCVLHFIDEHGAEFVAHASVEGSITLEDRGEQGFSYDPIFWYPPLQRSFAELRIREKNAVSHRAIAMSKLLISLGDSEERENMSTHEHWRDTVRINASHISSAPEQNA